MLFISEIAFIDFTLHEIKQCIVFYTLTIGHESSPFLLLSTQRFQSLNVSSGQVRSKFFRVCSIVGAALDESKAESLGHIELSVLVLEQTPI